MGDKFSTSLASCLSCVDLVVPTLNHVYCSGSKLLVSQ